MWMPDRGQESKGVRRAKGLGEQRGWESKGVGRAKGSGGREDKGDEVASLFLHQIIDSVPAAAQLLPSPHFSPPPTPLYCRII